MNIIMEQPVNLYELLARKEARAKNQLKWSEFYHIPLVSFTVNMPGPVKLNDISCQIFKQGTAALTEACKTHNLNIVARQIIQENTGPEGIFAIEGATAHTLKKLMMKLENEHPLGRLMDLDVIDLNSKMVSRKAHNISPRRCLICDDIAASCARSQRHNLEEVLSKIEAMVHDHEYCN